jgi:GDP-L-fucose synthase
MPDGMPRKCLDVSRLHEIGFHAQVSLEQGIPQVIDEYRTRKARGEFDEQHS